MKDVRCITNKKNKKFNLRCMRVKEEVFNFTRKYSFTSPSMLSSPDSKHAWVVIFNSGAMDRQCRRVVARYKKSILQVLVFPNALVKENFPST